MRSINVFSNSGLASKSFRNHHTEITVQTNIKHIAIQASKVFFSFLLTRLIRHGANQPRWEKPVCECIHITDSESSGFAVVPKPKRILRIELHISSAVPPALR